MAANKADLGVLPSSFLSELSSSPLPVTKTIVDWSQTHLPHNAGCYAVVLDNVLTAAECNQLTSAAVAHAGGRWEPALVRSGGSGQQRLYTELRNNERIMWDNQEIVARLWARIAPHVPELRTLSNNASAMGNGPVKRGEIWEFDSLNERMRFLQYGPGEYFKAHCDGAFSREDGSARTFYTLHLYLNERTEGNELLGGATSFHHMNMQPENDYNVVPKAGRILIFQHRNLLHSGEEVEKGLKLTLRTDLLFRKTGSVLPEGERVDPKPATHPKRKFVGRGGPS